MNLSDFIRIDIELILNEWEEFAKGIPPAHDMTKTELRDHAREILNAISADLNSTETREARREKSHDLSPRSARDTYAAMHGAARKAAGFSVNDTVSEFRNLRASILKLWMQSDKTAPLPGGAEIIRFNESIDEALTQSLDQYSIDLGRYRCLFETVLSSTMDLSCIFGVNGRLIYSNESFACFYEMVDVEVIDKTFLELGIDNATALQQKLLDAIDRKAAHREEIPCTLPSGKPMVFDYLFVPVSDHEGNVETILVTARDITERKKLDEKISRSANYDGLTGLTNRSLFRDRLEWEVRRSERNSVPLALLFIDLDDFKAVNDLLGHDAGDLLLQQAAQRIGSCVRRADTVARIGGDEFTVILTEVRTSAHIDILAQKIIDELSRPFLIQEKDVKISASVGITLYPQDAETPEILVRNADQAMYSAKKAGRNRFNFFDVGMRDSAWGRLKVIEALRHALPANQFDIFYQPIVDLSTGRIGKAEALLRWHHPENGLMYPEEFIGLAEEAGLIGIIDDWVVGEAVTRSREWCALLGTPFQISVNKSPMEFMSKAPMKNMDMYLTAPLLDGSSISVEITEGVLLNDSPNVIDKLNNFKEAGVQLAIDDFGTGYASMAFLKKFKVDYLKIDQSFVNDMTTSMDAGIFAETIIVMAHKLGLKVIAEGVETVEQRDWLKSAGCDYAQGYFFSKPVASRDFARLLGMDKAQHPAPI